ncbi:hypothetical protein L3Q82_024458 [Scortum barcoo]|uniref:Uncharacterized protein n=1 Tax=Scortum barcoo TaxID=214431 RepID=A0ACB8WRQ9_9TELE|nr:hypothetical protein L3Q82_024458 [Scortum barcoo]
MEEDYRSASKRFWQTVRRLRRGKQYSANTVYSAGGKLLTSTGDIVGRWKKYFEDLLNPTDLPSNEEAEAWVARRRVDDEIRPEYLKSLDVVGLSWLTRLCNIAWRLGTVPLVWQTGVVVPLFKKGDRRVCSNYRGITLQPQPPQGRSTPGYWRGEFGRGGIQWFSTTRGFRRNNAVFVGRGTLDQLYTSTGCLRVYGSLPNQWSPHGCFAGFMGVCPVLAVDWRNPNRVHSWYSVGLCSVREYGVRVREPLLRAVRSLYDRSRSLVRTLLAVSQTCSQCMLDSGRVALCHRVLFIIFMDRISRRQDLQHVLERFAAECEAAGMRISTSKSEAMVLDRKRVACPLQVGGEVLPQVEEFKYLGVLFTSEGKIEREIDRRIGAASAVMRSVYRTVVVKKELSRKAKLSRFTGQSTFPPSPMGEKLGHFREELGVEPLLLHIERSQLRWLGHLFRMPPGRLPRGGVPGMSHREEASGEDPGHAGETMSLGWPGNASGSPRKSWRKCLGQTVIIDLSTRGTTRL